jgi:hypothetical protein
LDEQTVTAEGAAWIVFWTRAFTASLDALVAFEGRSGQMLTILERICFEMELQLLLIKEPLVGTESPGYDDA